MTTSPQTFPVFALFALLALILSGCGIDGEPKPPAPKASSGVSITGEARVGTTVEL